MVPRSEEVDSPEHDAIAHDEEDRLWQAITDPEWNGRYGYAAPAEYELKAGGAYRAFASEGMKQASAAMGWELAEYAAFIRTSPERDTAYTDTLGDMTMGSLGAMVAALVIGWLWHRGTLKTSPHLDSHS